MKTIDEFLIDFLHVVDSNTAGTLTRVYKPLRDIAKQITDGKFLTKKQAELVVSKLQEISISDYEDYIFSKVPELRIELKEVLTHNCWSRPFTRMKHNRTMTLDDDKIIINFTFCSKIKTILKNVFIPSELKEIVNGELYHVSLTEINIVLAIKSLKPFKFKVQPELTNYYKTLTSMCEVETKKQFYFPMDNENFKREFYNDVGDDYDDLIIKDRRSRYQYFTDISLQHDSLAAIIADRTTNYMWLDNKIYSLTDILSALIKLKRFPLLFVFNNKMTNCYHQILTDIKTSLNEIGITNNIGVYFRLPNNNENKKLFNKIIAENQYNSFLDETTQVAMIENDKLPKFILGNVWNPKSVIMIENDLRNNKVYTYAANCDLIISYSDSIPLKIQMRI